MSASLDSKLTALSAPSSGSSSPWDPRPVGEVLRSIVTQFSEHHEQAGDADSNSYDDLPSPVRHLVRKLESGAGAREFDHELRELSFAGFLREALAAAAAFFVRSPDPDLILRLASELLDALAPPLGLELTYAALHMDVVQGTKSLASGPYVRAHQMLGDYAKSRSDFEDATRHYEAILAYNLDDRAALSGWQLCKAEVEDGSRHLDPQSDPSLLLDGLDEIELAGGMALERYELKRPLGRGRHALVVEAYDHRVGRRVAVKRLLDEDARKDDAPRRVLEARFFAEAKALASVCSPYVLSLLDIQPRHRFIVLPLCLGGTLREALRKKRLGPSDLPRLAPQLRSALRAVELAGRVHRDVKPANILLRDKSPNSPIALGDFGLARGPQSIKQEAGINRRSRAVAGTLRYMAPEVRRGEKATPASDRFSAGVVLLEIALAPRALPPFLDRTDGDFDASSAVPPGLPDNLSPVLERLLHSDPNQREWEIK